MSTSKLVEEMEHYYALRASSNDRIMGYDQPDFEVKNVELINILERYFTGEDVLEIAFGAGYWTTILARTARSIVATDFNESAVIEARKKELAIEKVKIQQADAYALEGVEGTFTAAFFFL